jgi:uncharacterized membrane protein
MCRVDVSTKFAWGDAMKELAILVLGVVVAVLTIASTQVIGQKMSDRDVEHIQSIEDQIAKERNAEWEKQQQQFPPQ